MNNVQQGDPALRFTNIDVPAGSVAIRVTREGYQTIDTTVVIGVGDTITVPIPMRPGGR